MVYFLFRCVLGDLVRTSKVGKNGLSNFWETFWGIRVYPRMEGGEGEAEAVAVFSSFSPVAVSLSLSWVDVVVVVVVVRVHVQD